MPKGQYKRTECHKKPLRTIIIPIGPSIAYVHLTRGQLALIDREDVGTIRECNWAAQWNVCTKSFYAIKIETILGSRNRRHTGMHRALLSPSAGRCVDHISGNTLDNRRANLREATFSENSHNRGKPANNTSGFKGVSLDKTSSRCRAIIRIDGLRISLGSYGRPEEAAEAYKAASQKYYGKLTNIA